MKGIDIFCASQAATAICLSMEEASSSSPSFPSSTILLGSSSPAIDRYNPIIRDSRRNAIPLPPSTTSQPPVIPKPHKNHRKKKNLKLPPKENGDQAKKNDSSTTIKPDDEKIKISNQNTTNNGSASTTTAIVRKSWSCTKPGDFISPPGSTRYLLSEKVFFNALPNFDPALKLFPAETSKSEAVKTNGSCDAKPASPSGSQDQVVVLRVSLHCRGCERKMRKHISRMEGVTSFNIDFAAKKVTVTGNIPPLEVLSSISKVKNAQLWPPTISSSTPPAVNSEFKNEYKGAGA
ncbi:hypothetical protein Pfo_029332 [Paulownia fortunei]|nr:hypothetical protein Pfo_029332 [Paulownia fortunei]